MQQVIMTYKDTWVKGTNVNGYIRSFFDKYKKSIIWQITRRIYRCFSMSYHNYRFSEVFLTGTKNRSYDWLQDAYIDVFQCHITTFDLWRFFLTSTKKRSYDRLQDAYIDVFHCPYHNFWFVEVFFDKYKKTIIWPITRPICRQDIVSRAGQTKIAIF